MPGISDFQISVEYLIKENCHNSKTNYDIDLKLGQMTKLDKRNKTMSKKFEDDVMAPNCDVIVIFPSFGQFGAIRKPHSGRMDCKTLYLANTKKRTKKSLTKLWHYCFE